MNIVGHLTAGVVGSLITGNWLFLLGSIIPDLVLIPNEIKLLIKKETFNKWNVIGKKFYDITHSFYFFLPFLLISPILALSILIHQILDIPFHTSNFRWNPFLIKRKPKMRAVLFSGGTDSVLAAWIERGLDYDLVYFNYGQEYHELEFKAAKKSAKLLDKRLIVVKRNWEHDIENRNYYLISEIKKMGYDEVITGNRNLLPVFDKYGDSNWFNLKLYQYLIGIYINMPLIGLFKLQINNWIKETKLSHFSSENWNKNKKIKDV